MLHLSTELKRNLGQLAKRPDIQSMPEINKKTALKYLAPEIMELRALGTTIEEIRDLLRNEGLVTSRAMFMSTLSPSKIIEVDHE